MRYLMILEVSQKQAYIFSSTKLKDNIEHSNNICQVTDIQYFQTIADRAGIPFSEEDNLVYSGGGHTVLEFDSEKTARKFAYAVSRIVKQEFTEIALFIKVMEYDESKKPGENLEQLTKRLEVKKSVRKASFHQGSFGIERIEASARKPKALEEQIDRIVYEGDKEYTPEGYKAPKKFGNLGNSKYSSSFIAVVHIDGNAMGKRVEQIRKEYNEKPWNEYKSILKRFSDSIDEDFKSAYREMTDRAAVSLREEAGDKLDLKHPYFPIRKIILAGDDVCFVTEGRIGLEAARIFIEQLSKKKNRQDGQRYTACAGVAIVHQKYPFYKAYELSEMLCSNAKSFASSYGTDKKVCAIDWHIELGELVDSIEELRENYITSDGCHLELRPYLLWAESDVWEYERIRRYDNFKKLLCSIQQEEIAYAKGKLKEFREALRSGETTAKYYLESNLLEELSLTGYEGIYKELELDKLFSGQGIERKVFVDTCDGKKRSLFFDSIEMMDTFVALENIEK